MDTPSLADVRLGVIGLGYVGLPLAVEFGTRYPCIGYDIDERRVGELTCGHDAFETPFGTVPVDHDAVQDLDERLRPRLGFGLTPVERDPEHSLEMELPFLQRTLNEFALLPVVLVDQSPETSRAVGEALSGPENFLLGVGPMDAVSDVVLGAVPR